MKEIYFAGGCFWGVEEYFSLVPGVVDAVLVAQGVELLLVDEVVDHLPADRGGDAVVREAVLVLGGQLDVAVAAADDQDGLSFKLLRGVGHVFPEGLRVLVLRAHPVVDDGGPVGRARGELAVADGFDAVGLMEGPGDAVDVDVPSEEEGLETLFHGENTSFVWIQGHGPGGVC